jgi:AmmeMemoRadiSam system protein B
MLRPPAVAGRFYPADPIALTRQIKEFVTAPALAEKKRAQACLVPHAGYTYSGAVAGRVFAAIEFPRRIIILGVRHFPRGQALAIVSEGAWQTPLGAARIDTALATQLRQACPLLREDTVAHSAEHSLEVQLPFLQVLAGEFHFVPVALGTARYDDLCAIGEAVAQVIAAQNEPVLILTSSDMNHYEDDATTRKKDHKAIDELLKLDPRGLYDVVRQEEISMCGLGPAVAMLTAVCRLGASRTELVKYATSGDVTGDRSEVVGYAGIVIE